MSENTKSEAKPAKATKEEKDPATDAIKGPATLDKSVVDQAKEARNLPDPDKDDGGKVDSKVKAAAEDAYTPEMKLKDAAKEAKKAHLKDLGLSPRAASESGGANYAKVETADVKGKMYSGIVTMTGYSGEYHQKVSQRIDIGPVPRGWDWCANWAFPQHMGAAAVLTEIDEENKADPLLRTTYG